MPQTPVPTRSDGSVEVDAFGWSGGYVGFRTAYDLSNGTSTPDVFMSSTSSPDGVHWTAARPLDVTGFKDAMFVTQVLQGPSGLLALGQYMGAACGGPATIDALWTSPDGNIWTRVTPPADFAAASIYTVAGGSIGFIATGTLKDGVTQAIWLSPDGRTWTRGAVPKVTTGTFKLNGATAFAAGYVAAGAILGDGGCGGPGLLTPSLWWSATGTAWTRVKLAGATPANDATITVTRIDDHTVMAVALEWSQTAGTTEIVWVTSNGKDWTLVKSPSSLLQFRVISNGQRTFAVPVSPDDRSAPAIQMIGDDASIATLTQSGDVPAIPDPNSATRWTYAVGPSGLLCVATDGSGVWLGAPTA
jgi:hypothetical protein